MSAGTVDRASAEPSLPSSLLGALREARATFQRAARNGDVRTMDAALDEMVRAALRARFAELTVRSVVHAALDEALPRRRSPAHRVARHSVLLEWTARAGERFAAPARSQSSV